MDYQVTAPKQIGCTVELPASKSLAVRALIINALANKQQQNSRSVSSCDDCETMFRALASCSDHVDVGPAGTAMRFLTAYFAMQEGREVTLDGNERMRQRPIGILVDALRQMGASIDYLGRDGFPPLRISGRRLHGGHVTMAGNVSSQFVSSVLMIAPLAGGMTLTLDGDIVSRPYIDMTLAMMHHHGINAHWLNSSQAEEEQPVQIVVPEGEYSAMPLVVEGDWSAASYWLALQALLPQSAITLKWLSESSVQGDSAIVKMMEPLGVTAEFIPAQAGLCSVRLGHDERALPEHYDADMSATPDLVPSMVVTLCLLRVPFTLSGVGTLRIKESDRLESLSEELGKLGYLLQTGSSTISYDGNHTETLAEVALATHGDHRMAMALALASTRHPGITIKDAEVVTKSYPQFWHDLAKAGMLV